MAGTTPDGWSAYDQSVPAVGRWAGEASEAGGGDATPRQGGAGTRTDQPAVADGGALDRLVERMDQLRDRRHGPPGASLADVRQVVVVVASSRGGTSLFGELLRRVPGLLHLRAEINPFFALAGLYDGAERRRVLKAELLADIGRPAPSHPDRHERGDRDQRDDLGDRGQRHDLGQRDDRDGHDRHERDDRPEWGDWRDRHDHERWLLDVTWRLLVQWPTLAELPLEDLVDRVAQVARRRPATDDPRAVVLRVVAELRRTHPDLHPGYYDIPDDVADAVGSSVLADLPAPAGPPGAALVEMPPFGLPGPWQPATRDELRTLPLVLTTPRNSFRLAFLAELFPAARLRILHLTRNPAASVNGLIDGWLHHGFFNCPVPVPLRIDGYSDVVPGGDRWWCYDLPPGWTDWVDRPLADVCAFQWQATHAAALAHLEQHRHDVLRVRFEDLVGPSATRLPTLDRLASWLGVGASALRDVAGAGLPVVMATAPPAPRRWTARADQIRPALRRPEVAAMAEHLGYHGEQDWT